MDKNAVCITLCRRTKYDADAWNDPPRLMSGEVRPPTVFTKNRVIAQRHFNATLFAQFLRIKIRDEQVLGPIRQSTALWPFLPLHSRSGIPNQWLQGAPPDTFLDFADWLKHRIEEMTFCTSAGRSLLTPLDGFQNGQAHCQEGYIAILDGIASELEVLLAERLKLFTGGQSTSELERAIKDLLGSDIISVLAKRGFLPRYAFPLDLVTLETGWSRWSRDVEVELSRDRGFAIAEFAPGAQVVAHKKVFTSAGLYIVSKTDEPKRRWFSRCRGCDQIRTAATGDQLVKECEVCQQAIAIQDARPFVQPVAFSVRIEKGLEGIARFRRNTMVRQRQSLTHFIDFVEPDSLRDFGLFQVALKDRGRLFRYNLGPQNKGFMLCPKCGCSEPLNTFKPGRKHRKLRAFSGAVQCENDAPWGNFNKPLAYGHEFETFCLIARPVVSVQSIESLAYALQKALCGHLDVEASDIGVSWRFLAKRTEGSRTEVVLYDRTPGGAGLVKDGFDNWREVIAKAIDLCKKCSCDIACYDCLKDYGNQTHHEKLNRLSTLSVIDI